MSSAKDILMANKLKEGIQDAIVYLRMLEGAKLAPVYERKRHQLMGRLDDLIGDTRREAPPRFEEDDDEDETSVASVESPRHQQNVGEGSGSESSKTLERRNSKLDDIKNRFEQPKSKGGYRYKTLDELKKESANKRRSTIESKEEESKENEPANQPSKEERASRPLKEERASQAVKKERASQPSKEERASQPSKEERVDKQIPVIEDIPVVEELKEEDEADIVAEKEDDKEVKSDVNQKKSRTHTLGSGLKKVFKKKTKDRPIADTTDTMDTVSQISDNAVDNVCAIQEEEVPQEEEEGFKLSSRLERVNKRLGRYNYQEMTVTLDNDTVTLLRPKDKEGTVVSLIGAATAIRDSYQFELHSVEKSYTFRTDSEDLCIKWVDTLKAAIDACTPEPVQEEIEEEDIEEEQLSAQSSGVVPEITVSGGDGGPEEEPSGPSNIRESASYENFSFGSKKKKQEMPDASVAAMKGNLYKKGTFGWDRVWGLFTHDNVIFLSTNETSKKVIQMIQVTSESKIEKKKGSDKYPHAVTISAGKIKETLASDSEAEFGGWIYYLEHAAGCAEIQELLSEDEGEELYEELAENPPPKPPSSPRPSPASYPPNSIPTSGPEEELYDDFEGDIYEGLDEIDVPEVKPSPVTRPSLPPRNEAVAPPSLPPRNDPKGQTLTIETPPLPPRPGSTKNTPLEYEAPTPSPPSSRKPMPLPEEDDEVYDDVVVAEHEEDLEETYDDVVSMGAKLTSKVSSGDLYEDMTPQHSGSGYVTMHKEEEQEEYQEMELGQTQEAQDDELYVDVDEPPPPRPPPPSSAKSAPSNEKPPPRPAPPKSPSSPITSRVTSPRSPIPSQLGSQSSTHQKESSPVTTKSPTSPITRPTSINKKQPGSGSKVAHLSKMFGEASPQQSPSLKNRRGSCSGTLLYQSPGKKAFSSEWCVLEGSTIIFYTSPNDKLSHFRLNVKESELHLGTPDGKGSKFAFYLTKGSVVHRFSTNSLQELGEWIGPLAKVSNVVPAPDALYQAKDDYTATKDSEISFKKGDIIWVIGEDTPTLWTGVVGSSSNEFTSGSGTFPSNMIELWTTTEDVYI